MLVFTFPFMGEVGIAASKKLAVSWGQSEVSFEKYRLDSVECGKYGAKRDMSSRTEYKQAIHGIEVQNSALDRPPSQGQGDQKLTTPDGIDRLRDYSLTQHRTMQNQVLSLQRFLVSSVESCLYKKGYRPFFLTNDQNRKLSKLHKGSQQRFQYLYSLSSDEDVLAKQSLPDYRLSDGS